MQKFVRFSPAALLVLAGAANAEIATTAVTAAVGDATTAGTTIGLAVLGMIATLAAFKWIRRAM